jgi:hypothetical protein
VTANFSGAAGGGVEKVTDVAPAADNEHTDFNHRFVWRLQLPCVVPRLSVALWHSNNDRFTFAADVPVGEALVNLQPLLARALQQRRTHTHQTQIDLPLVIFALFCIELFKWC